MTSYCRAGIPSFLLSLSILKGMGSACCKGRNRQSLDTMENQPLNECKPVVTCSLLGTKYDNPLDWDEWHRPGALAFLKMKCSERNMAGIPSAEQLDKTLPVHTLDNKGKNKLDNPPTDGFQIMWIGHATLLVQFDGITVLTDPVFLYRCAPVQFVGPKRYRPVPCDIEDLPRIDAVIISHNHYDHLEYDAVVKLNYRFGDQIRWFVPLGLKDWFIKSGCSNVIEMNWWEECELSQENRTNFICVPAQHWSQRGPLDAMKSLWCGWVIKSEKQTFYYSGDTGYCPVFKQIGEKFGPIDLSAIPIGCYCPRYFMKPQHIGPEQAVIIHNEVKSKKSVAVHWGTFDGLGSHEPYLEPQKLLRAAVKDNGLSDEDFFTVEHGDIKVIDTSDSGGNMDNIELEEPDSIEQNDGRKIDSGGNIQCVDSIELVEPDGIEQNDGRKIDSGGNIQCVDSYELIEPDHIDQQKDANPLQNNKL